MSKCEAFKLCSKRLLPIVKRALKTISLGQYRPKLYYKGESKHATVISGIFTLLFAFVMISYTVNFSRDIFLRKHSEVQ